jgi:hypothetical protein
MKNSVDLSLCIWNFEDVTHEIITNMVGVKPYKVYTKGEKISKVSVALSKQNGWILKPLLDEEASFEEQMNALLEIIESKLDVFESLTKKYYCEFSCGIYIYTDSEESTPGVHLNKQHNELLGRLGIEFDLDIILLSDSEDK